MNEHKHKNPTSTKYSTGALFLLYLMITVEIIMMASPFTAYYYVAYGPVLKLLNSHDLTRWLGAFFLPHMVFPASLIFTFIRGLCVLLFYGGIVIFFSAALPLYYRKFRRKGLVTGGLYNYVRHPQYFGLAMWGLGLLLFWPRFLILLAYVVMLFLYYFLAKNEESRFASGDYEPYRQSTGMFFPRIKCFTLNFRPLGFIENSKLRIGMVFILAMGLSIVAGFVLRNFTLSQLPQIYSKNMRVISVKQMPELKMKNTIQAVLADPQISSQVDSNTSYLAYIMPQTYMMSALIAKLPEAKKQDKSRFHFMTNVFHKFVMQMKGECCLKEAGNVNLKIIFLEVSNEDNSTVSPSQTLDIYVKRTPILYADLNPQTGKILAWKKLLPGNKWGNLPQAVF